MNELRYGMAFGHEHVIRLASDQSTASTSYVDCTGLAHWLEAGSVYLVEGIIVFQSPSLVVGIGLSYTIPSGASGIMINQVPTSLSAVTPITSRTADGHANTAAVDAINSDVLAVCHARVVNGSTAGLFQLRYRSSLAANTVVVKTNSLLRARRVL
mgnify:CR=1 FL=1